MVLCQSIYNSEYNFLPQGIKMEQFFARSFHLKKYLKLFLQYNGNTDINKNDKENLHRFNSTQKGHILSQTLMTYAWRINQRSQLTGY